METKKEYFEITYSLKEREFYEFVFNTFATNEAEGKVNNGFKCYKVVTSVNVKSLFQTSGLQSKELASVECELKLRQIWNLSADKKKKNMDQSSFCVALKLLAIKQNGKPSDDYKLESLKGL